MNTSHFNPVGADVVQRILLCDLLERFETGPRTPSTSQPGHLMQLTIEGNTDHEVGGRRYRIGRGDLIWYHEDELVRIRVHSAPWRFYTVNFLAPNLPPPPFERRVLQSTPAIRQDFSTLLEEWRCSTRSPLVRELLVHSAMAGLLARIREILDQGGWQPYGMDEPSRLWWDLESKLRQDLSKAINLTVMEQMARRSAATIARSCRAAVGIPPMRRVKEIRMSLARGLVLHSDLRLSEIAERLGYPRPHEFSRDYRKHFGKAPRQDRVV